MEEFDIFLCVVLGFFVLLLIYFFFRRIQEITKKEIKIKRSNIIQKLQNTAKKIPHLELSLNESVIIKQNNTKNFNNLQLNTNKIAPQNGSNKCLIYIFDNMKQYEITSSSNYSNKSMHKQSASSKIEIRKIHNINSSEKVEPAKLNELDNQTTNTAKSSIMILNSVKPKQ